MQSNNVIILKQLEQDFSCENKQLNGIVRLEHDSGITELSLSLVNVATLSGGKYILFLFGNNGCVYHFNLPNRPTTFRKSTEYLQGLEKGFACALVVIRLDLPLTVAFGKTSDFDFSLSNAKKLIAERCIQERKQNPTNLQTPPEYDDEAVATVNYFELEQSIKNKSEQIKEKNDATLSNENGNADCGREKEEKEDQSATNFFEDETDCFSSQNNTPFFATKLTELENLFKKFPPYTALCGFFPDSRWVKIYYDTERFYVVGLIKENKKEKYICYGVPGEYSPEPPKELKGYCQFIPLSIFDLTGQGFWMMFQDAITGNCIFPQ